MSNKQYYLPWVRQGLATAISDADKKAESNQICRASIEVSLKVNQSDKSDTINVCLYGPGDVISLDPRQVIRTEPVHLATDFEPNYFPFIEFDRPDLPWLFTPAAPNGEQLTPWICLVVVERREGVSILPPGPGQPLPILHIENDAYKELPPLEEAWAWAHAQVTDTRESDQTPLETFMLEQPETNLSRLLCPRKLDSRKTYYACVVPTYEAGRQAGLGQKVDPGSSLRSWGKDIVSPFDLPIYYHWEFSTGADGDFESIARRLERRSLKDIGAGIGQRPLKVEDDPVAGLPNIGTIRLGGALQIDEESLDPAAFGTNNGKLVNYPKFKEQLIKLLNLKHDTPWKLPLPIYGQWHAAQREIPSGRRDALWLRQLNQDPRYRIAAGLGTQVVQKHQEELMTAAWKQVGAILEANQILRQAQLAREGSTHLYEDHLNRMDPTTFLLVTAPVHTRVVSDLKDNSHNTTSATIASSKVPAAVFSAAFRRLTRLRGPLTRRVKFVRDSNYANWTVRILKRINSGEIETLKQPATRPGGMVTIDSMNVFEDSIRMCKRNSEILLQQSNTDFINLFESVEAEFQLILTAESLTEEQRSCIANWLVYLEDKYHGFNLDEAKERLNALIAESRIVMQKLKTMRVDESIENRFQETSYNLQKIMLKLVFAELQQTVEKCNPEDYYPDPKKKPQLEIEKLNDAIMKQLDPSVTITRRISRLIKAPEWKPEDPLEPVMAAPEFPTPMYKYLAEFSSEWLLPGLEHVPSNTVSLVSTNNHFIEAYMVGLNHEMGRELLWRGYPTDQRGTYFHQFWDPRSRVPKPEPKQAQLEYDIQEPISEWYDPIIEKNTNLGEHLNSISNAPLVVLIRGELLQRCPRAIIYFARAKWKRDKNNRPVINSTGKPIREPELPEPGEEEKKEKYPDFIAKIEPDITFLGFTDIDEKTARGASRTSETDIENAKAGYFLVIQQPPTEPRYGLDQNPPEPGKETGTWRDLSWENINLGTGDHLPVSEPLKKFPKPRDSNLTWSDMTSAKFAAITRQQPFRIAIHASDLLPDPVEQQSDEDEGE